MNRTAHVSEGHRSSTPRRAIDFEWDELGDLADYRLGMTVPKVRRL